MDGVQGQPRVKSGSGQTQNSDDVIRKDLRTVAPGMHFGMMKGTNLRGA